MTVDIPIIYLSNGLLIDFDARDSNGKVVPILSREYRQRWELYRLVQLARLSGASDSLVEEFYETIEEYIYEDKLDQILEDVVASDSGAPVSSVSDLISRWDIYDLLAKSVDSHPIVVSLKPKNGVEVFKFRMTYWPDRKFRADMGAFKLAKKYTIDAPDLQGQLSNHIRLIAPPGTIVSDLKLIDESGTRIEEGLYHRDTVGPDSTIYVPNGNLEEVKLSFRLVPHRNRFLFPIMLSTAVNTVLLSALYAKFSVTTEALVALDDGLHPCGGRTGLDPSVMGLVLAFACSIISVYFTSKEEHPITSEILSLPRWAAGISGMGILIVIVAMLIDPTTSITQGALGIGAALSFAALLLIICSLLISFNLKFLKITLNAIQAVLEPIFLEAGPHMRRKCR